MPLLAPRLARRQILSSVALAAVLCGCHPAPAAPRVQLSSEGSDYSPTARLAIAWAPTTDPGAGPDSLRWNVRVDSGVLAAPGSYAPGRPAIMRAIRMAALLVRYDSAPSPDAGPGSATHPWTVLSRSADVQVADSLSYGERVALAMPLEFTLARSPSPAPPRTGIVFEITAGAVSEPVRMADGSVLPGRYTEGGVRVYACSATRLDGRRDRRRAKLLARRYLAAC